MSISGAIGKEARIAIIGGGQLGYMLCEAARSLGIKTLIVTPDSTAPALKIADESVVAPYNQAELAKTIARQAELLTFEFEAVPDDLLAGLEEEQSAGNLKINPAIEILRLLKDRSRQKHWLGEHGFASADYIEINSEEARTQSFLNQVAFPFVQKALEGGYDGYGVQIIRDAAGLEALWPVPSIIEVYLGGARELSVVAARSSERDIEVFPPVEMAVDQSRNILDLVISPADLSEELSALAETFARDIVEQLQGVGVFAIEMFLSTDGQLLVNEIAPRVHNSGHHTLESCNVSQFEQHIRAVAGLSLVAPELRGSSVMKNILYEDALATLVGVEPGRIPVQASPAQVHWYGKMEARLGRKMGHITCVGVEPEDGSRMINEALSNLVHQHEEERR